MSLETKNALWKHANHQMQQYLHAHQASLRAMNRNDLEALVESDNALAVAKERYTVAYNEWKAEPPVTEPA